MGHHQTYFVHFASALARAGCGIVPFYARPADFLRCLEEEKLPEHIRQCISEPVRIAPPDQSGFRPARWRGQYDAWRYFGGLGSELRAWERQHGEKIDLVFFACIYDRQFRHFRFAERRFGYPWAGLYLHARSFRMPGSPLPYQGGLPCPEEIFSSPLLRAAAVLDEKAVEPLQKIACGKPVFIFPDVTVEDLPPDAASKGLGAKIKEFAAGRPIVSLSGHLQWTKGFDVFTQMASRSDMRDVFFFLGGDVSWTEIPPADRQELQKAWEECPNLYVHLQHLPEPSMNSVYAVSDVVVAAYRAFPNSSNALTKAAVFERPIVVSDGYLMAERVRRYGMGEVVPEGDAAALCETLRRMLQPAYQESLRDRARWREYREAHSAKRLNKVFAELVAAI